MRRLDFIDVCKGFGIFYVILAHTSITDELFSYIDSFTIPIFFFVGGFLYKESNLVYTFGEYILRKIKRILVPYLLLSIVSAAIYIVYYSYLGESYDVLDIIKSIIISKRNKIYINVPLWFLTSFFTVEIIYYILKCCFNNFVNFIIVFVLGAISIIYFRTTGSLRTLPWSLDVSFNYIMYYFIGDIFYSIYKHLNKDAFDFFKHAFIVFLISIIVNLMNLFNLIRHSSIIYYDYGIFVNIVSYLFHIFISLTGVFTYLFLSYLLKWVSFIRFIGRNSIYYFGLHIPIYNIFYKEDILSFLDFNLLRENFGFNIVGIINTIIIILVISFIPILVELFKGLKEM